MNFQFKQRLVWLMPCIFLHLQLSAQPALQWIARDTFPESLQLFGDFQPVGDSSFILVANGGLYSHHPQGWLLEPDTNNLLLSYRIMDDPPSMAYAVQHRQTRKSGIYLQMASDSRQAPELLADLPKGAYRVLQHNTSWFVYGFEQDTFRILEYTAEGMQPVYTTTEYIPNEVRVLNHSTLLLNFGRQILALHRVHGLQEFIRLDEPITSFVIIDNQYLLATAQQGICLIEDGRFKVLVPETTGILYFEKDRLYVLNPEKHSVDVFKFSGF